MTNMKLEAKQRLIATENYSDSEIIEYAKEAGLEKSLKYDGEGGLVNTKEILNLLEKRGWLGN